MYNRIDTWRNKALNRPRDPKLMDPEFIRHSVKNYLELYRRNNGMIFIGLVLIFV